MTTNKKNRFRKIIFQKNQQNKCLPGNLSKVNLFMIKILQIFINIKIILLIIKNQLEAKFIKDN